MKSVSLPKQLKKLENWTFIGCAKLTEVTIPDGVADIGIRRSITAQSENHFHSEERHRHPGKCLSKYRLDGRRRQKIPWSL
ncbi:MAG: hypothetical protein ACLTXT_01735 [Ruminococcus callidus]